MILLQYSTQMCWICGRAVHLDTCKTDEHGSAVHEQCYVAKIALEGAFQRLGEMPSQFQEGWPRLAQAKKIAENGETIYGH